MIRARRVLSIKALFAKVNACSLPEGSRLLARVKGNDFIDCYCTEADVAPRQAAEIITAFPAWSEFLLKLRSLITSPFGLSQQGPDSPDKLGAFPVEQETENEIIAGFNDKHLDFRVSVVCDQGKVFLATWVHPHNVAGWIYLRAIMPFHILIARDGLVRVSNQAVA